MQPFKYRPRVNSGDMRNRVDIYADIKQTNEIGEVIYRPMLLKKVWASVVPQTGRLQNQQADTILTNVTHKIIIRYNKEVETTYQQIEASDYAYDTTRGDPLLSVPLVRGTRRNMFVLYRGQRFNVRYILNPFFRDETLEIFCEELIG